MSAANYRGSCFCGNVEVEVTGEPLEMGFCHCTSCRTWLAAPIHAFTLWKPEDVRVCKGEELIGVYKKTERSHRKFCRSCGGHVMNAHPSEGFVDVFAAVIPGFPFQPTVHVHYAEKVLSMRDGLPKFRDFPKEYGGSGETLPE